MSNLTRKFGVCSVGKHVACVNKKATKAHKVWEGMIQRCYHNTDKNSVYWGCEVDSRFYDFQDFAEWRVNQVGFDTETFEIDKDILAEGRKLYSPDHCVFVPPQINSIFTGHRPSIYNTPLGVSYIKREDTYRVTLRDENGNTVTFRSKDADECFRFFVINKITIIKAIALKWRDQIDVRVYEKLYNITESQILDYFKNKPQTHKQ